MHGSSPGTYGLLDDAAIPHATAYRPPLYPAILAATIWCSGSATLWGIAAVHAALATLSAALLLSIGRALHVRHALAAVLLFSLDPLLIRQSQLIMTETMATTVGLFSWWLLVCEEKWRDNASSTQKPNFFKWSLHLLTGLSFGIGTLTRPTAIVWLALIITYYLIRQSPSRTATIRQAAWFCLGFIIALSPWIARNREQFDKTDMGHDTWWLHTITCQQSNPLRPFRARLRISKLG
jgi:4-amino-4-deoxy-L-arabinose transferase-like glycosyltransferase